MHELKQVYQKHIKIAFGIAFLLHAGFVGMVWQWSFFQTQERTVPVRMLPYADMMAIKTAEPEAPGAAPLRPPPPEETPTPQSMSAIIPVPDWMASDSLMAEPQPAPEQPIQETAGNTGATGAGGSGQSLAGAGGGGGAGYTDGPAGSNLPVDEMPRLLKKVEPVYPRLARVTGVEGVVVLSVLVDESGHVTDTQVLKSLGNAGCDEAAVTAARQWRFAPATKNGRPVAMWMRAPILFQLKMGQ